jgi:hypothetical protein
MIEVVMGNSRFINISLKLVAEPSILKWEKNAQVGNIEKN